MIKCKNIAYKSILKNVSFQFEEGEICMLVGPNGCGKTTLIRVLVSLLEADDGHILYKDKNISTYDVQSKASIFSYIPQIKSIPETMTVLECVVSGKTRLYNSFTVPTIADEQEAVAALRYCGIEFLKDRYLDEISGGELQLVYVARCLVQDAKVMVMDEPCSFLDVDKQILFLELVKNLKKAGKTVMMSMHDPNLTIRYADRIFFMRDGLIYASVDRTDAMFKEKCTQYYNELYGNRFLYNKELDFLFWE